MTDGYCSWSGRHQEICHGEMPARGLFSARLQPDLTRIKPSGRAPGMMKVMLNRVIPIRAAPPVLAAAVQEPQLSGRPDQLRRLLAGLERLAGAAFGPSLPRGAWLRGLTLADGEAVLSLAPALRRAGFAQAAFELLK